MTDSDMREVLISLGEIVKTEFLYLSSIHTGVVRIHEALTEACPGYLEKYNLHSREDSFYREYPGARQQLEQLALLLERLRKA